MNIIIFKIISTNRDKRPLNRVGSARAKLEFAPFRNRKAKINEY
jgi:hypothetical protein